MAAEDGGVIKIGISPRERAGEAILMKVALKRRSLSRVLVPLRAEREARRGGVKTVPKSTSRRRGHSREKLQRHLAERQRDAV